MKPKNIARNLFGNSAVLTAVIVATFALPAANAATLSWDGADATFNASLGGTGTWNTSLLNWGNGAADVAWTDTTGLTDIASFGGTAGAVTLGTNVGAKGLVFGAAGYTLTGSTLTLGSSGIDASALSSSTTTISSGLTLASGIQTWNVGTGSTLALNSGTFSRSTGAALLIDKSTNTGTVSASNISNTNGIVGPWAIVKSTGTVGNGVAAGYNFATKDGSNNLVAYTGATAVTTGYPSSNATTNYDWSSSGTQGAMGSSRLVNTIRYTGTGVTQQTNSTQTETINGLMNAGTGTVTLGGGASTMNIQSGTGELVLAAMTSGITINGIIINNGATAGAVTILGANNQAVTLGGTNTFTGDLTINGTLNAGTAQGSTPTASNLGALQPGSNRNITVNNGGTLALTAGNVLGTGGSTNTLSNTTLVVNAGGVFQTGLNGSGTGWWNKIGATTLNGGTIHVGSGANTGVFQGLALIGNVTVAGSSASTIDNYAASNSASNGIHLGQNATANQSITFNVADVTNSSASDLDVSAKLLNTSSTSTASGLTKTGAGTMTLSATSAYTGATTISAGTIQIGNGTTDGSIATSSGITNNATLAYNLVGSQSYANAITGTGALTKAGVGTLTLSGANTYTGTTTLNAGGLILGGSLTSNITANSGTTVGGAGTTTGSLAMSAGSTFSGNISGIFTANGVSFNGATNLVFNGATVNGSTYDLFNYGAGGVTGLDNLSSSFRAVLTNDVANTKVTANVSTGTRTWAVTNGTWQSGNAGAANWAEGDQKYFDGDTIVFADPAAASTVSLSGTLLPVGVTVSNTNDYTFSGSGAIGGTSTLTKSGNGQLNINNVNSYTGATAVNAGTTNLAGSLGSTAITVASGATFSESGAGVIGGTASLTTSGTTTLAGSNTYAGTTTVNAGTLNLTGSLGSTAITVASGATFSQASTGVIGSAASLTTSGTTTLLGTNTYTGSTTISAGTLQLGDGTTNGSIAYTSGITNNSQLAYNVVGAQSSTNAVTGTGSLTKSGAGTLTWSGSNSSGGTTITAGAFTLNGAGSLGTGTVSVASGATLNFYGNAYTLNNTVTGAGNINVATAASSTITGDFSGFTGTYTHNSTTASSSLNSATATSGNAAYVIASAQGSSQGMIAGGVGNYTLAMGSLSGVANSLFRGGNVATGTTILEVGNLNSDATFDGIIANGATKTIGFTKVGTGKQTLTGVNTYTGATTVSAGTLLINGSLGNTAVTVNGGTLGGSGTIGSATAPVAINSGGTLAPGNSPGTLTINGATTLGSGSTYAFQYTGGSTAANSADLVDVNGTLTISSGALLTLQDLGTYTMGDKLTLFAYDTLVGSFDAYADDQTYTINGGEWVFNYNDTTAGTNGGSGAGYITITAVPEPAALLLGSLGVLTLLRRRRVG